MRADEIMTSKVCVVTPETSLKDVASFLLRRGVGALPVVDAEGKLVGMLTEADLIAVEAAPDPRRNARRDLPEPAPAPRTAGEAMSTPVVAARVDTDVAHIVKIMLSEHITRVPVLDQDQRLVGLVSRSDLLRPLARPDTEIEADVRRTVREFDAELEVDVLVAAGEATLTMPRADDDLLHLVRAVPGVIAVHVARTARRGEAR